MSIVSKFLLKGKIAVVTGGYGHLGKWISQGLAEAKAKVIVGARSEDKFRQVFGKNKTGNISFVELDISSTASIKNAFKNIQKKYGAIDILINNAFYSRGKSPESITDEEWD